jgi:S-formylglutathione hydrolase FrmB
MNEVVDGPGCPRGRHRLPRLGLTASVIAAVIVSLSYLAVAQADPDPGIAFGDGHELTVVPGSVKRLDSRLYELRLRTAALPEPTGLRVLMPSDYRPGRRYPALWLFSGATGAAADWTEHGEAEQATAGLPVIVVMPDTTLNHEFSGFCNNWADGRRHWETYQISQLLPWTDDVLPTLRDRAQRAVAGVSGGGLCSTSIAARHPDLFAAAASYSGMPDISYDPAQRALVYFIISEFAPQSGYTGDAVYGNPFTNAIQWAAYDPTSLAENLRSTSLHLYTGNGTPGPYDDPAAAEKALQGLSTNLAGIGPLLPQAEAVPAALTESFHRRLDQLGIPNDYVPYGPGTHNWPYFVRAFRWSLPKLMDGFAHPEPPPAQVNYTSADDSYAVYGWQVTIHRHAREFSTLHNATTGGFQLAGSGEASITTPPAYHAGTRYTIVVQPQGVPQSTTTAVADHDGRLRLSIPLGPSNPFQEDTAQAAQAGTTVFTTTVTIR